jgi:predicted permease
MGSQMALSLALLVAGALFVRGALKAADATPGFALDRGLLAEIDPSLAAYSPAQSAAAHRGLLAHLRSVPGVEAVSMASLVPFGSVNEGGRVEPALSADDVAAGQQQRTRVSITSTIISADYFTSLGLEILRGRDFTRDEAEGMGARRVAVIDAPLAERLFPAPGENPVGQYIRVALREPGQYEEPLEVVGVVPGIRDTLFDRSATPHLYVPFALKTRSWMNYHIRIAGSGSGSALMLQTVRREIRAFDERLPVLALTTLRGFADRSVFLWVFQSAARIFTVFGLAALALALVGIYGVNSYVVARRTREIGIRMALGATSTDVVRLVLRDAAIVSVSGIVVGLGLAVALGTLLSSMLYGVGSADPLALVVAPLLLGASARLASYIPARRATRIALVTALRHD